ncbi:MAG: HD domain-containing protein [Pseudomonadota bacterium]
MKTYIKREEARNLLKKYLKDPKLLDHCRESEVVLEAIAKELGEDAETWALAGLLHDIDLEVINHDFTKHGLQALDILKEEGYELPEISKAIACHAENLGYTTYKRESKLDYALAAGENATGLIYAYALMRPNKNLDGANAKSLTKKFKDRHFAASVDRGLINDIEKIGLDRKHFFEIALEAMKSISDEIGL